MATSLILIIDLGILGGMVWWLYKKQDTGVRNFFIPALTVKLLAGIVVGWIYFYYYGQGDTITYWQDGKLVAHKIITDPAGSLNFFWSDDVEFNGLVNTKPRSLFFVKISGLLAFVSAGHYGMMALLISFFAFWGAWYLFLKTQFFFPESRWPAAVAYLFYPSTVIWSSGLIKESLGLGALFFLAGFFLTIAGRNKVRNWEWILAVLSLWFGWSLKYYWIGVFLPLALTTLTVLFIRRWKPAIARFELIIWTMLVLVAFLIATGIHPNFYLHRIMEVILENNTEFMLLTDPDNAVNYPGLRATVPSMMMHAPAALLAGLLRPFVWETHNIFSLAAGLENFLLLLMILTGLPSLKRFITAPHRLVTLAVLVHIIMLAVFLALSTPNLGTLSRYKAGFIPFLVFISLYQNRWLERLWNPNPRLGT